MDDNDDAGYIRIPTKLFVSSIGSVALVSAGFYGAIRPAPDQQQLATLENDLSEIRVELRSLYKDHAEFKESARAGGEAIVTFSQRIADNRQLILDNTTLRWTSAQQDKYQRDQSARDESQERRIMLLERDVDKLGGRQ
jgi:predicted  nucleic acid-binding Zn-ribbon protein